MSRRNRRNTDNRHPRRVNALVNGGGAETLQDRGSLSYPAMHTRAPYYLNNIWARNRIFYNLYSTSWEAKKIVDLPIQDAFRNPVKIEGLKESDRKELVDFYEAMNIETQLRRAFTQERLLGGAALLGIFYRPEREDLATPLKLSSIEPGDFAALNVVDLGKLARTEAANDVFSPDYDRRRSILIDGIEVHGSRLSILDGNALFNWRNQGAITGFRHNPMGFGDSVLTPLYDLINRVTGTQQAAYHLINMSSVLIFGVENMKFNLAMGGKSSSKMDYLEEAAQMASIYRAMIVEGKGVEIGQHAANFGSVPELLMSFLQILSAGSDIPATRFLGQAPGGLNATGVSDLENYYNMVEGWRRDHVQPVQRKKIDWLGCSLWGYQEWKKKSAELELVYEPLWNLSALEQSQVDNTYAVLLKDMYLDGLITAKGLKAELQSRKIFNSDIEIGEFLERDLARDPSFSVTGDPAATMDSLGVIDDADAA